MSELALKLIKEAKEKRLTRLDLGNCGLTELPDELFELVWLEELNLSKDSMYQDFDKNNEELFRSKNQGTENNIRHFSPKLNQLKQLKTLFANGTPNNKWMLNDLSPLIELLNLQQLNIYYTQIEDLSPLKNLTSLRSIDCALTKISTIADLSGLIKLQWLSISDTLVSDLYPLKNLKNLQSLWIYSTKITDLTALKFLKQLRYLKAYGIKITDISPLEKLYNLRELDLQSTRIKNISALNGLHNLKAIYLHRTEVSDLSQIKNLIQKGLTVTWNDYLDYDEGITIENCPLINPPIEIAYQGNEAILRYWQELENKETITNNQTKLIFVGNSRAGKTSLWQFLKDKTYNDQADSTHGIKTEIWDTETLGTEDNQNLAAHIWDFGGQEYYHATHRIFLAHNAVYILVWDKETNIQGTKKECFKLDDDPEGKFEELELEHFPASYWIDNIHHYGRQSPFIVVQNKVDDNTQIAHHSEGLSDLSNCFHISLKNAYQFQQGNQSFKRDDLKFQDFKERLLELLRANATSIITVKYYAQVREELEKLAKEKEYITKEELKDIALQFDETPDMQNLLAYLKSFANTVLYFSQNPILRNRLYLNPTHISRDIYKILNKQVRENNGKFGVTHIKTRLNLTDDQEAERFVALMREFDLIFEKSRSIKGIIKRQFITPQYLPKKEDLPEELYDLVNTLPFEIGFYIQFKSFVPRSLMLRFIASNGEFSNQETYWRNGIIYKSPTTQSMIKVEYDHEALTFTICVQDKAKQTIDMQNIVEQFVRLENSDENIKISNDRKLYVDLRTIRKLQHENSRGDIYENGELIPLSKFDWLTQKQEVKEHKEIKIEDRLLKIGNQKYSFDDWNNGLIEIDSFDTLLDNFPINERLKILDESKKIVKKLANIELNRLKSEFETGVSKTISYPKLLELELKYYESILESDSIKSPRYVGTKYPQEFINEVRKAYQNVIYGNIDTIIANPKNEHSFSHQFAAKTFASIRAIAFGHYYEYLKGLNPQNFEKSEESMTLEQVKETVRELLGRAKQEAALKELANWAYRNNDESLKDTVAQLSSRLTQLYNKVNQGLISESDATIQLNTITSNILDIIKGVTNTSEGTNVSNSDSKPDQIEKPNAASKKLKILMLTANPTNQARLRLDTEHSNILQELQEKQQQFTFVIKKGVSKSEFQQLTVKEKPDILHFSGHGESAQFGIGGLILQDIDGKEDVLPAKGLNILFRYFKSTNILLKATILNACYSEEQAQAICSDVPYVIGTTLNIGDRAAIAFSMGFYNILAENGTIEQAFNAGITRAAMDGADETYFALYKEGKKIPISF